MPSDKELSQEEIDAQVYEVTRRPDPKPAGGAAPANKSAGPSAPAQPERDPLPARLTRLENDITTLKKELQALLLDLREKYLEAENPFNSPVAPSRRPASSPKTDPPKA